MLKLGACSWQRDSGRHPNSQCCKHKTTALYITAWIVTDFKSWLTSKIVKVMFADNCIHYDFLLVCFIKLIKLLWFFSPQQQTSCISYSPQKSHVGSSRLPVKELWMAGAAGAVEGGTCHLQAGCEVVPRRVHTWLCWLL